jgi:hypothetical protein
MAIEFYTKNAEDDGDFNIDSFSVSDQLSIYIQEIRNMIACEEGSVLGASDMSIDLESLIYDDEVDENELRYKILSTISRYSYFYNMFDTAISVKFYKGEIRDICFIDFIIQGKAYIQLRVA